MPTIQVWSLLEAAPPIGNVFPGLQEKHCCTVKHFGLWRLFNILVYYRVVLLAVCACALWIQRFQNMLKSCSFDISNLLSQWHSDSPKSLREPFVFSRIVSSRIRRLNRNFAHQKGLSRNFCDHVVRCLTMHRAAIAQSAPTRSLWKLYLYVYVAIFYPTSRLLSSWLAVLLSLTHWFCPRCDCKTHINSLLRLMRRQK